MLDTNLLYEETQGAMSEYFASYQMAHTVGQKVTSSDNLPACQLMPFKTVPNDPMYDGTAEQGAMHLFRVRIVAKIEDLAEARKFALSVFRGRQTNPAAAIAFQPIEYTGGEIETIDTNVYYWIDEYATQTLGGC